MLVVPVQLGWKGHGEVVNWGLLKGVQGRKVTVGLASCRMENRGDKVGRMDWLSSCDENSRIILL